METARSNRPGRALGWALCLTVLILWSCDNGDAQPPDAGGDPGLATCPLGAPVATDGHRRLALVVGVGDYRNPAVTDLAGPPGDARRFYDLLTGPAGYGFPKENVCLLRDGEATTAEFKKKFDQVLVDRVEKDGDVAVFFYAGHGSRTGDTNGDEPDPWDETFMFHDARSGEVKDLVDDELNAMLARLHGKTSKVTVILDSCNSSTATRGTASPLVARFQEAAPASPVVEGGPAAGDGGGGWLPEDLPGMVVLAAAGDNTPAMETGGQGIFTDALLQVLGEVGSEPLTYAQVARRVPPLVAARSYQTPYFHGDLGQAVFDNRSRSRPVAWEVRAAGPPIELAGPPLPGLGAGAELRIYDGNAAATETKDSGKAKATVVVDEVTGLNATAHVLAARADAPPIEEGDLAVLARPGDAFLKLTFRARPAAEAGGVPAEAAAAVQNALASNEEAALLVEPNAAAADFELAVAADGCLELRGPENRVRKTYRDRRGACATAAAAASEIVRDLWQHARQSALLQLRGEGGGDFVDGETLLVQLVPATRQSPCADGVWVQAEPNSEQVVPLCHEWNIRIELDRDAPLPLLVGGVILSTDGSLFGFPADGRKIELQPGEDAYLRGRGETFAGGLPLDVRDYVLVFGTQKTNPMPWNEMTRTARARSAAAGVPTGSLYRALDLYLQPGTRGVTRPRTEVEDTTWTMSAVALRTEANSRFLAPSAAAGPPADRREYTIASFDLRPYLPDRRETALYKVLTTADALARTAAEDGVPYKQHDWSLATDEENLGRGIDCSRSIWYAFTRAGLPYNDRGDGYLPTVSMVAEDSAMSDRFSRCDGEAEPRLGDVLVYRDEGRKVGHTVMVIDPGKRIAWGSHGWDGNVRAGLESDTGVEYQLIKYKPDWRRWDRSTMELAACWRYDKFIEEAREIGGQPGVNALAEACDPDKCTQ